MHNASHKLDGAHFVNVNSVAFAALAFDFLVALDGALLRLARLLGSLSARFGRLRHVYSAIAVRFDGATARN